ncbi:hypothetical protein [Paraburkholderia atlantica]|uniref:hypothetical protein n=1 Tax=Paraburkholderia atlantica TaxID=2654982 RepID=UPI00160D6836|nr:hypothetical protein [Paraburkholderia atlantica]MBB5506839.1 hypothetical protein [Paraburkholderia atlantica]
MKTSEANLEFSYDSQYRAEVARKTGNIVNFGTTVSIKPGPDQRLFPNRKQSAALQLALSFLFEQTQRSLWRCGNRKDRNRPAVKTKSRPRAAFHG